jgi:predicted amino acid-binding ACT domain protein
VTVIDTSIALASSLRAGCLTGPVARYVVTAVGVDRPGVVAALSGVLVEQRCSLEDSQMAVLGGHAAMMLVVDAPPSVTGGCKGR